MTVEHDSQPEPKILAFAGSCRRGSFNRQLLDTAADLTRAAGAAVTTVDLCDFDMPIYNQDLEAEHGLPDGVRKFRQMMIDHDGLLIASPEYNSSLTPLLKNAIDWASRVDSGGGKRPPLEAYRHKTALLVAASPGKMGGLRGLSHLRSILQNIGVMVIPRQLAVGQAHQAFADDGSLADDRMRSMLEAMCQRLVGVTARLLD